MARENFVKAKERAAEAEKLLSSSAHTPAAILTYVDSRKPELGNFALS